MSRSVHFAWPAPVNQVINGKQTEMLLAQYFWKGYSFGKKKEKKREKKKKKRKKKRKKNWKKSKKKKKKKKEKQSLTVPNTVLSCRVFWITIEECLFYRFFFAWFCI